LTIGFDDLEEFESSSSSTIFGERSGEEVAEEEREVPLVLVESGGRKFSCLAIILSNGGRLRLSGVVGVRGLPAMPYELAIELNESERSDAEGLRKSGESGGVGDMHNEVGEKYDSDW